MKNKNEITKDFLIDIIEKNKDLIKKYKITNPETDCVFIYDYLFDLYDKAKTNRISIDRNLYVKAKTQLKFNQYLQREIFHPEWGKNINEK